MLGELYFVGMLLAVAMIMERECRKASLGVVSVVALCPFVFAAMPYLSAPQTFRETIVSLKYHPTTPALHRLRYLIGEGRNEIERQPESFPTLALENAIEKVAARLLKPEEHLQVASLVFARPDLFEMKLARTVREFIPIPPLSQPIVDLLAKEWRPERRFCFYGHRAVVEGYDFPIEQVMQAECGETMAGGWDIWYRYRPWKPGAFEARFERLLLDAKDENLPFGARRALVENMIRHSTWRGEDKVSRDRLTEELLADGVTSDRLAAWRQAFFASERAEVRAHLGSLDEFRTWIASIKVDERPASPFDEFSLLRLVCEQVAERCTGGDGLAQMNPLALLATKVYVGFTSERVSVWWIKKKILESPRLADVERLTASL